MFTSFRVAFVLLLFQGTSVLAEEITVQFRPEKEEYHVGEPVFLVLDLVNAGSQTIRVSDGVCWTSAQFDIPDAPRRGASVYTGARERVQPALVCPARAMCIQGNT